MVNNQFNLIGMAVTDYVLGGTQNFPVHMVKVEVDKTGNSKGKVFTLEVVVYSTNKAIDVTQPIMGKMVAITGYIDSYVSRSGIQILKMVGQSVLVFDRGEVVREPKAMATTEDIKKVEEDPNVERDNDDLPF